MKKEEKKENKKFIPFIKCSRTTAPNMDFYIGINGKRKIKFL